MRFRWFAASISITLLAMTAAVFAQQGDGSSTTAPAKSSQSGSSPSNSQQSNPKPANSAPAKPEQSSDSQGLNGMPPVDSLSRDTTFPGDRQENQPESQPAAAHKPDLTPPRSDRVRAGDLGKDVGQSSSKVTQEDISAPADDARTHPQSAVALSEAE